MARSTRTSNPVTLFPFLAVLLCTIGALVLMLVVVSAGIRKDAVAMARQKKSEASTLSGLPEQSEPPLSFIETVSESPAEAAVEAAETAASSVAQADQPGLRTRKPIEPLFAQDPPSSPIRIAPPRTLEEIADLEKAARKLESEVADRARRLESVNVKTYALKKQLRTVKAQQADLQLAMIRTASQRAKLEKSAGELRVENQQIIEWLDESRKLIDEHKGQLVSPVHSIVPYDGQTGTVRRPIIIECVGEVVRFEAEQVEIPIAILQKFSPEQNPLSSGVEALFRYWMAKEQIADPQRQPRKPYALILVRPSGAEAFSTAVFALDQMVGDFGYELVETDFLYEVPETTADAVRECRAAVEAEIRRGPIRSRRALDPQGPIDIARVARGPVASRGFFSSSDFRNRKTDGAVDDEGSGDGQGVGDSVAGRVDQNAGESFAAAAARREAQAKVATERARELLTDRGAEAATLLNKGAPGHFDETRAAVLAEAARVEAELRSSLEATGQGGLPDSFRNQLAARSGNGGLVENPLVGQSGNERSNQLGNSAEAAPGTDAASSAVNGVEQGGEDRQRGSSSSREVVSGPPRWVGGSGDRPAVGTGQAVGQADRDGEIDSGIAPGIGIGPRDGSGDGSIAQRGDSSAGRNGAAGHSGNGALDRGPGSGDSSQQTPDMFQAADVSQEGRPTQGQPVGKRVASDGQEISSLLNASTSSSAGSSSSSSSGGDSSPSAANGPSIPTLSRSKQIQSRKTQRRWGRCHPDASLGLEKVVEVRVESGRVVVGDQFQVTRTAERSEAEIVKLTIQTIEHLANQWGFPPPRFYWVPSVRLVFDPTEQRLGTLIEKAVEEAGAALE
ncbi:MAG: hypothetical protein O3B68_06505 [Planctomycetota bacterium]|nr:hypothetical protein [Planctomycetota bacterium]